MPPRLGAVCPFCETRSFLSTAVLRLQPRPPQLWMSQRGIAHSQKKRPSRMSLSPSVAKPTPSIKPKAPARPTNSPFGGMNRTDPGFLVQPTRTRSRPPPPTTNKAAATRAKRKNTRAERQPGDMKALRMQQSLSAVSYGHRTQVKARLQDVDAFSEFPLLAAVQEAIPSEALKGLVDITPTPIQRLAVPALLGVGDKKGRRSEGVAASETQTKKGMQQFLIAAETGSGKTLAYVLPTIDAIKRAEAVEAEEEKNKKITEDARKSKNLFELTPPPLSSEELDNSGRPRAIVLVPTSELVDQVGAVFKGLSHTVKLRVALISAAYSAKVIRNRIFSPSGVDVIVSTPHLLSSIATTTPNILSRVTHLICDEADSLFDRSFAPLTSGIIDRATPSLSQLILCSATIPRSLDTYLRRRFPEIARLATPNLHAIPRRVQMSVVDIDKEPYRGNRDLACADTIWNIGQNAAATADEAHANDTRRIIVFVNERERAKELAEYLASKGIDAAALSRDMPEQRGSELLDAFTSREPMIIKTEDAASPMVTRNAGRTLPNTKVLVMTDLGSRGIDTIAVRTVVLYDVPHSSIDFIHRLGRVGRMGRRGRGIVLVGKDDRKDVVREVREGMFRGQALI